MASKPETRLIKRIEDFLPKRVYSEKMANPYRGGTPDMYYEGDEDAIWIEYKFTPTIPIRQHTLKLSDLQQKWLLRCEGNGRSCAVVLGWKTPANRFEGALILKPSMWVEPIPGTFFEERRQSPEKLANIIGAFVCRQY